MGVRAAELQPFAAQAGGIAADHAVAAMSGGVFGDGAGRFGQVVFEDEAVVNGGLGGSACGEAAKHKGGRREDGRPCAGSGNH